MHQVDVRYSQVLVRAAVRAFYWRTLRQGIGWPGLLAFVVGSCALGFLILAGDRSWLVGFAGACFLIFLFIISWGYIAHLRNTTARFKRMSEPQARFVFSDGDFSVTSDAGSATLPWASVREVWVFPEFWLFLLSRAQFLTLPTAGLSDDVLTFVRSKTKAS
jgi:cbb3-type cytochrome oxidase subunit 3